MEPLKWSHDSESWFKTLKILHSIIGFISAVKEQVLHSKMCLKGAFLDSQRACVTVSSGPQGLSILRPQRRLDLPRIWPLLAVVKPRSLRGVFQGSEQDRVVRHNKYRDCRSGWGWGWVSGLEEGGGGGGRLHLASPRTQLAWDEASPTTAGSHLFCEPSKQPSATAICVRHHRHPSVGACVETVARGHRNPSGMLFTLRNPSSMRMGSQLSSMQCAVI